MADNRKDATHPSEEVIELPMQHRVTVTSAEWESLSQLARKHTEKVTDKAFSENRSSDDVREAVFWRGLSRRMVEKLDNMHEKERRG